MAMDTTIRPTTAGATGSTLGTRANASARLVQSRAAEPATDTATDNSAAGAAPAAAPLRSRAASIGGALQDQVARAQQALDYLDQVAGQLESVKGELSSRLAGARSATRQQASSAQLNTQVRQLVSTLAARRKKAGGGVDSNLNFSSKPAVQRFRIHGLDLASLRSSGPQSLAFSVGGIGGPQLSVNIDPSQTDEEIAAAVNQALAPMGVNAGLDGQGGFVFTTPESNWPAVKDSIAISGRGRVGTEEVAPELAPQQWTGNGGNGNGSGDALRASLREVVQALERVRRSRDAASNALSAATVEMTQATTPPPEAQDAAQEFATTASNPDYESLLSLTSALVGVSRERVLALLGLKQS
ncbi:hypothetical protein SRABI118_03494 [Massilia sp. Bi118]|uniref:hypothetical protein n=1 Tax=Massilia sp. Bi118 TaxID=2822346 RepID=UPI001D64F4F9|nr:hypothetical protein [Massilia sp. Bi118]CAH0271129.1 hypothetical protein SRABI118_03494 [Massilia sp. Bi118]